MKLIETGAAVVGNALWGLLGDGYARKNRGRSENLLAVANPVTVIECRGDNQLAAAMTVACSLNLLAPGIAGSADLPAVRGTVQWGVDGFMSVAEFDWSLGTILNLSASFIQISAQLDPDAPDNGGAIAPAVRVGAHLSYLPPRGIFAPPFRTRYFSFGAGASQDLLVPPFAGSVRVLKDQNAPTLTVQQRTRLGTVTAESASTAQIYTELANDTRTINVSSASALSGRALFGLRF